MGNQKLSLLMQALFVTGGVAFTARTKGTVGNSPTPQRIAEDEYYLFQKYANYTSASTSLCGATPLGGVLSNFLNIADTDTQAALFRDDGEKEFVLAMPGTASIEDSKLDTESEKVPFVSPGFDHKDCDGCYVHKGFLKAWQSLADPAANAINEALAMYPDYQVSITGHSLGGAIASLATAGLVGGKGIKIRRTVTFGEPRVGGPHYANYIDKISGADEKNAGTYHRVTHANDIVPQLPPREKGYQHSGTEYWESNEENEDWTSTYRCFGQEPDNCNDGTILTNAAGAAHLFYAGIVMGGLSTMCAS